MSSRPRVHWFTPVDRFIGSSRWTTASRQLDDGQDEREDGRRQSFIDRATLRDMRVLDALVTGGSILHAHVRSMDPVTVPQVRWGWCDLGYLIDHPELHFVDATRRVPVLLLPDIWSDGLDINSRERPLFSSFVAAYFMGLLIALLTTVAGDMQIKDLKEMRVPSGSRSSVGSEANRQLRALYVQSGGLGRAPELHTAAVRRFIIRRNEFAVAMRAHVQHFANIPWRAAGGAVPKVPSSSVTPPEPLGEQSQSQGEQVQKTQSESQQQRAIDTPHITELRDKLGVCETQLSQCVGRIDGLTSAVDERNKMIGALEQQYTQQAQRDEDLTKAVSERDRAVEELTRAVHERDVRTADLRRQAAEQSGALSRDLSTATTGLSAVTRELKSLEKRSIEHENEYGTTLDQRNRTIEGLRQKVDEREKHIERLKRLVDQGDKELAEANMAETSCKDSVREQAWRIDGLRKSINEKDTHLAELRKANGKGETDVVELGRTVNKLREALTHSESRTNELQKRLSEAAKGSDAVQAQLDEVIAARAKLRRVVTLLSERLRRRRGSISIDGADAELNSLQSQLGETIDEPDYELIDLELAQRDDRFKYAKDEIEQLNTTVAELRKQLADKADNEQSAVRIRELQSQLTEQSRRAAEYRDASVAADNANKRLATVHEDLTKAQLSVRMLEEERAQYRLTVATLERRLDPTTNEYKATIGRDIEGTLKTREIELRRQARLEARREFGGLIEELQGRISRSEVSMGELLDKSMAYQKELETEKQSAIARRTAHDTEIKGMQLQLSNLNREFDQGKNLWKRQLKEAYDVPRQLQSALAEITTQHNTLREESAKTSRLKNDLERTVEGARNTSRQSRDEVNRLQSVIDKQERAMDAAYVKIQEMQSEISGLRAQQQRRNKMSAGRTRASDDMALPRVLPL